MKFNATHCSSGSKSLTLLKNRIRILLLFLTCFTLSGISNTLETIIDMDAEFTGYSLSDFISFVEKNSDYKFFLNNSEVDVDQSVTSPKGDATLNEAIETVLTDLELSYQITENKGIMIVAEKAQAEDIEIYGIVTDSKTNETLLGVTVAISGTTSGTITNVDGQYNITAPANATLIFSFIGYEPKNVEVNGESKINLALSTSAFNLDEIVMIGYGTTTKRKSVGSVATMKAEKLEATPFSNVGSALQGQVSGLIVTNSGGGPGSTPSISIRGGGDPLYVIDGVITSEADFNAINSEDIETVSFLKDAAATAVFGARGGNGIVLVTTKKGEKGTINVNYSYNYQMSQPTTLPEMMNSYEFAQLQNAAAAYDGEAPAFSTDELEQIRTQSNPDVYPDNNWPELTLKDFAPEQKHNLSLRGGDDKSTYFVSLGYVDQGSLLLDENAAYYNRFNVRSNLTTDFDRIGLQVGINLNASVENYRQPFNSMYNIWRMVNQNVSPLYRAYNLDGTLAGGGNGDHPLAITQEEAGYQRERDKFINTQAFANWEIPKVKGLKLGVMANYRDGDGMDKTWENYVPLYMQDGSLMTQGRPSLNQSSYYTTRLYLESSINYGRTFGKHGLETTFVYNQTTSGKENFSAARWNYESDAVDQLFAGPADAKDNNGNQTESANKGYVVRLKYDYNYKYILEFNGRYDGNDNFAEGHKWGFFPSASAAWNVTEEGFMQNLKDRNILTNLKLRASFGQTGVLEGVNRFGYIPVYNLVESSYNIGNSLVNGYSEGALVNPAEMTWYNRTSLNYAVDFSTLDNKLNGTFEYFYYRTTNYLMSPKNIYSQPLGKDLPQVNSESAHRRAGYEFNMSYRETINDFQFEVGGNLSYFNQLWEKLDTEDEATLMNPYTRETQRIDYWAGGLIYQTEGLYQNANDILNTPRLLGSTETQNGDMRYIDGNGDGKIDEQDKRLVNKPTMPRLTYGINFSMKYKGWFMNGLFQGTGERYMGFDNFMVVESKRRTYKYQMDYWTPENTDALFPRISQTNNPNGGNNTIEENPSDFYLKNARYFRLKSLQIGYDLKKELLDDVEWIANCRVYATGTNLLTFSPVKEFFDPEQVVSGSTGNSSFGYPVQRTYSFGINVGF